MRVAEGLTKNSAPDMATIFGVREDAYSLDTPTPLPPCVNPKRSTTLTGGGDNVGAVANPNKRDDDDGLRSGAAKKKKKSKRVSE